MTGWQDLSSLWFIYITNNCLASPDATLESWLNATASDDWTMRHTTCPTTRYFWNVSGSGDWNDTANWYTNIEHTEMTASEPLPNNTNTAIILSNVTSNTGPTPTVKTLQV